MSVLRAVELIKAAAEAVSGYTFETGTAGLNNIQADKIAAPMVVLDRPLRINKTISAGGGINESYEVSIGIFDLSDLAYTYAEHEPIIFTADQAANQIIVNLNSFSEYVKAITDIQVNDVINALDVNVSGVFVRFTLELFPEAIQPCPDGTFVPEGLPPFKTFLTQVAVDGETITGNGTPDNPLVAIGGGGSLRIQDEGATLTNAATTLNFTGDGVTASLASPGVVEVNVPGGSGGGGDGTVTSVAATVPSPPNPAFSVVVTNPSTTPSVDITANGNTSQVILGDGSLASASQVVVGASIYQEDTYISNSQQPSVEYVASVGKVYVPNQSSTNVTIYNAINGDLLATIPVINALKAKYISSINEVWVTSSTATTIWRIDTSANTLLGTITTGVTANGWDILEYSSTKVFITCDNISGSIMVLNPSALSVTTTITLNVPAFPLGMALNTNPSSLQFDKIVVCSASGVAILDPNTNAISTTLANPSSVFNTGRFIRYSATEDKYYAASRANNRLVVLSIATATTFTATFIPNNLFLMDCAVDDANDLLFTFPMEGGTTQSILVKVYKKSTLTPIVAFKTSCLGGTASQAGFHALDLLNKRIFVVGRSSPANGAVSVIRYL